MDRNDIRGRLTTVFQQVLGDEKITLNRSTTARDVEGWDSLMHINLIVAIEREFGIRFTTREITVMKNVGDLMDLVARKNPAA